MTADEFRALALNLPETTEAEHMGHPDFRVNGKIFATLQPDPAMAMVKLPPDQQELFMKLAPEVFAPVKGAWGKGGATNVRLSNAPGKITREALLVAWRARAPKRLANAAPKAG